MRPIVVEEPVEHGDHLISKRSWRRANYEHFRSHIFRDVPGSPASPGSKTTPRRRRSRSSMSASGRRCFAGLSGSDLDLLTSRTRTLLGHG
jgi:hypothetical protein